MFLFNAMNFVYTCVFLIMFVISFFVILFTNISKLFKQGAIWPIRIAQVLLALILAYLSTQAIMALVNATQFN